MSTSKKTIGIYHNLPSGGALSTLTTTAKYLSKYYKVKIKSEPKYEIKNFFHYLYTALILSSKFQKGLLNNFKVDLLIVYHSWLVKSPSILRYSKNKKIYICHEVMREYYDPEHKRIQDIKEIIINILRLPIKWLDFHNIRSANTIVVANSRRSKKLIDLSYNVKSIVIYPGIDTAKYGLLVNVKRRNQVICIGSINKYKRQEFLVQVIGQIPTERRPELLLMGNGVDINYLSKINNTAIKLKVHLKIKINLSEKEKIAELHKSKAFMYAPIAEPFGLVIEEAIASGLPIVVYKHSGGFSEIITEKNGLIMNTLNANIWAENLEKLIINDKVISKYSDYNSRYAKKYLDSSIMNKQLRSLIQSYL